MSTIPGVSCEELIRNGFVERGKCSDLSDYLKHRKEFLDSFGGEPNLFKRSMEAYEQFRHAQERWEQEGKELLRQVL